MPKVTGLHFVIEFRDQKRYYEITEDVVRIGRDSSNHLQIDDPEVSRKHAHFRIERGATLRYVLEDHSSNGTFVNGEPMPDTLELRMNDKITLSGDTCLILRDGAFERPVIDTDAMKTRARAKNPKTEPSATPAGTGSLSQEMARLANPAPTRTLDYEQVRREHLERYQQALAQETALDALKYLFISHATDDDELANQFYARLREAGLNPWVDHEDIPLNADWETYIQAAMEQSWAGLQIITRKSLASTACRGERQHFQSTGKEMYIVLMEPIQTGKLPFTVLPRQFLNLTTNFEQGFTKLLRDLKAASPLLLSGDEPTKESISLPFGQVYLCHSHDEPDRGILDKVRQTLSSGGFTVWSDPDGYTPGHMPYTQASRRGIRESDCVVVLLTPDAEDSRLIAVELEYAREKHKPIFGLKAQQGTSMLMANANPEFQVNIATNYDSQMDRLLAKLREHLETK